VIKWVAQSGAVDLLGTVFKGDCETLSELVSHSMSPFYLAASLVGKGVASTFNPTVFQLHVCIMPAQPSSC
jgi:hypothetical protein